MDPGSVAAAGRRGTRDAGGRGLARGGPRLRGVVVARPGRAAHAHAELAAAAARFPESRWSERIGGELDLPLGTGVTYAAMLAGLVQHDAYHSGQVGLLRKALRL